MKDLASVGHLFACVFLFYSSGFMVLPAIPDVTIAAVCSGRDHCSLAIYLSGFQQAVTGLGTLLVTPLVGNLSDKYGRKTMLTLPMMVGIVPIAILAYDRSEAFFYAYYTTVTFTSMFSIGSVQCLSLAYVADKICERRRAAAFGVLSGVVSAAFLFGTLAARFLPTPATFKASAAAAVIAAVYMRALLVEADAVIVHRSSEERDVPSLGQMIGLLRSSLPISRAAIVGFFNSVCESGIHASLLYFLKAQFHFNKDQFADLLLFVGIAGAFSQLLLMPLLVPTIGEEKLLSVGLLASCAHVFLYSIAWSSLVPYFASMFVVISVFIQPCVRSIISRNVRPNEQGLAQGCITSINSFASIISPLLFTPLTALFLSDNSPFKFKGFSIMCIGFSSLVAFIVSIMMRDLRSSREP